MSRVLPKREETSPEANISSYFRETAELGLLRGGKMEEQVFRTEPENVLWVQSFRESRTVLNLKNMFITVYLCIYYYQ